MINPGAIVFGVLLALFVVLFIRQLGIVRRFSKPVAACEYWVYAPDPQEPDRALLAQRLAGQATSLLADVRLRLTIARREHNPSVFRPDLFDEDVEPTAELLSRIAGSHGIVKVGYYGAAPNRDRRYLGFVPRLADALAELCGGGVVFDVVQERLYRAEEFHEMLAAQTDPAEPEAHMRVLWKNPSGEARAETRGLRKVGLPELRSDPVAADMKLLVTDLFERASRSLFDSATLPGTMELTMYEDRFLLRFRVEEKARAFVSITRMVHA